jgi:ABC-type lipoprotein export system ATPase subunit
MSRIGTANRIEAIEHESYLAALLTTKAGVPVDGASGTGKGTILKGGLCIDTTNGNLYVNGGTTASPTWKLVTRAA